MGWFSKKKEQNTMPSLTLIHSHVWKDFPWYMECAWQSQNKTAEYTIVEPYVCIVCGERKNVKLEHQFWTNINSDTRKQFYQEVKDKYKEFLKPRAIVEDMINNVTLVKDINHLRMMEEKLGLPHRDVGSSANMASLTKVQEKIAPKIEIEEPYKVTLERKD